MKKKQTIYIKCNHTRTYTQMKKIIIKVHLLFFKKMKNVDQNIAKAYLGFTSKWNFFKCVLLKSQQWIYIFYYEVVCSCFFYS